MHFGASFSESRKLSACRARPLARLRKSSIRAWAAQGDESCRVDSAQNCIRCWRERLVFLLGLVCARRVLSLLVYVCVCVWKVRKKFLNKCICMYMCVCAYVCVCVHHILWKWKYLKYVCQLRKLMLTNMSKHVRFEIRLENYLNIRLRPAENFCTRWKSVKTAKKPKETTEKIQYIRVWHTYRQMYIYF